MNEFILTDYIFSFIVLTSTLFGFARGMLREAFTILNLTLAAFATFFAYPFSYEFFAQYLDDELSIQIVTLISTFILAWVIIAIINSFVLDMLKMFKGGFLDRILGMAFGVIRGALIVIAVYISTALVFSAQIDDKKLPSWLRDAKTLNYVKMQSQNFLEIAPSEYAEFYYNQEGDLVESITNKLQKRDIDEVTAKRLVEMGFTAEQVETMQKLYMQMPESSLSLNEVADLDEGSAQIYGQEAVKRYIESIQSGDAEANISESELRDLKNAFQEIK